MLTMGTEGSVIGFAKRWRLVKSGFLGKWRETWSCKTRTPKRSGGDGKESKQVLSAGEERGRQGWPGRGEVPGHRPTHRGRGRDLRDGGAGEG